MTERPSLRLMPKAKPQAIRHGFPWVYANEVVLDRRTKAMAPGSLAVLEDSERRPMGLVAVNPNSKIVGRMLDSDPDATIDAAWFEARLTRALAHRGRLYDEPYYRLIHAEADGLPGVVIDRFGGAVVIQPNAAWADARLEALVEGLVAATGVTTVVKSATGRTRSLEGLDDVDAVLRGDVTGTVPVPMNGAT